MTPALQPVRLAFGLLAVSVGLHAADPAVHVTRLDDRVQVDVHGQPFTAYIFRGAPRPYLYPVIHGDGTCLTRDFPMQDTPGEDRDHGHHRSLWFAHGLANGVDFWRDPAAGNPLPGGTIVPDGDPETVSGAVGEIRARHRWLAPDGTLICTDDMRLRFAPAADGDRLLDYEITIRALPDTPLLLGDTKEGTMAVRVAQWMTLPHRMADQPVPGEGHIVLSTGVRDAAAWGTRAEWCDYFGPDEGKIHGIALFDHPDNLQHPTWWMVRDYGLLAANPFGRHDFEKLDDHHVGDHTVPAGGSLTLRYRFYFHAGDTETANVAEQYRAYVAGN